MLFKKTVIIGIASAIALLFSTDASAQVKEIRTIKDYVDNCILENEEDISEECDRLREAIEEKKE